MQGKAEKRLLWPTLASSTLCYRARERDPICSIPQDLQEKERESKFYQVIVFLPFFCSALLSEAASQLEGEERKEEEEEIAVGVVGLLACFFFLLACAEKKSYLIAFTINIKDYTASLACLLAYLLL